jgi:hypothetical protein
MRGIFDDGGQIGSHGPYRAVITVATVATITIRSIASTDITL